MQLIANFPILNLYLLLIVMFSLHPISFSLGSRLSSDSSLIAIKDAAWAILDSKLCKVM